MRAGIDPKSPAFVSAVLHAYGKRCDPPCDLCREADALDKPHLIAPGNSLVRMLRRKHARRAS